MKQSPPPQGIASSQVPLAMTGWGDDIWVGNPLRVRLL